MKKVIIIFLLLGCNKNIKELTIKSKVGEIYWQYIKDDRDKELKEYLDSNHVDVNNETNEDGETCLTLATKLNKFNVVKLFLSLKGVINVNAKNSDGKTALIVSILDSPKCLERNLIIKKLLNNGADVNIRYSAGCNTLMLAIIEGDISTVKEILNKDININAQNLFEETALILATKINISQKKKIKIIESLLSHEGININLQDKKGKGALTHAIVNNNPKIVDILANRHDIDINNSDKENMAAFDYLNFKDFEIDLALTLIKSEAKISNEKDFYKRARKEHLEEIINLLIESKGNIYYKKEDKDLLHWSILLFNNNMYISLRIAKYFIDKTEIGEIKEYIKYASDMGSDVFSVLDIIYEKEMNLCNLTAFNRKEAIKKNFFIAVSKGEMSILKTLIEKIGNIDHVNYDEFLIEAINKNHEDIVKLLIERGADVNSKDSNGEAALVISLKKGYKNIVRLLIEKKADFNVQTYDGETVLMIAIDRDYKDITELLIEKGVNVNIKNYSGETCLIYAVNTGNKEIVTLLLNIGVEVDIKTHNEETALIIALRKGYKDIAKLLIEKVVNFNIQTHDGETALIIALRRDYKDIVGMLINREIEVNIKTYNKETALMIASEKGYKDIIELLIAKRANVDDKNKLGETALIIALKKGYKEIVELLIKNKADISLKFEDGKSPLIIASEQGFYEIVRLLLEVKANINIDDKDDIGETALMVAVDRGYKDIVELLIKNKADINLKFEDGKSPLMIASKNGFYEIVRLLLEVKTNINIDDKDDIGETALMIAIERGYKAILELAAKNVRRIDDNTLLRTTASSAFRDIVELLLEKGADIKIENKYGKIALIIALEAHFKYTLDPLNKFYLFTISCENALKAYIENIVKLLLEKGLEKGADINSKDNHGGIALITAASRGYKDIVELLLEKGADINSKDNHRGTPLIMSSMNGYIEIVKLLLEKRADINIKDAHGKTALIIALERGYKDIVELLLEKGASVHSRGENGSTALMVASEKGFTEIIKLLLEKGADINSKDKYGRTALINASSEGHKDIVELLLERGADINAKFNLKSMIDSNIADEVELSKADVFIANFVLELTALSSAVLVGHIDIINLLLEKDINLKCEAKIILFAVLRGNTDIVMPFIKRGMDVDIKNEMDNIERRYITMLACLRCRYLLELLLEREKETTFQKESRNILLMLAVQECQKDVVELLIKKGVDLNIKNHDIVKLLIKGKWFKEMFGESFKDTEIVEERTLLMIAALRGNKGKEIIELLLKGGADVNLSDREGNTALIIAVNEGHKEIVELLIKNNANVNSKNLRRNTALYEAIAKGYTDIAKILLEKGADINAKNEGDHTALYKAVNEFDYSYKDGLYADVGNLKKRKEMIELLLERGADISIEDVRGKTALNVAVEKGFIDIIRLLIKRKSNLNLLSGYLSTALIEALKNNKKDHKEVAKLLIEEGANINFEDKYRKTPLMYASKNGYKDIVSLLLAKRVDINAKDKYGDTALTISLEQGQIDIVEMLLKAGADISIENGAGKTPLIIAAKKGYEYILELLIKKGKDIENTEISMALLEAAAEGYKSVVELLLKKKPYMNTIDDDIKALLIISVEKGRENIVKMLLKKGVNLTIRYNIDKSLFYSTYKENKKGIYSASLEILGLNNKADLGTAALIKALKMGHKKIARIILKEQNRNYDNKYLLTFFLKMIKEESQDYIIACHFILEEIIKDNWVLKKSLEKASTSENIENLKEELNKKIEILKSLLKSNSDILRSIMKFI